MSRLIEYFWRFLPAVRRTERGRALFFTGLLLLVNAAQTVGLAGSEALFLSELSARRLPLAFVIAALVAVFGSGLYAARVGSARNDVLFAQMLLGAGVILAVFPLVAPEPDAPVLFGLVAAFYLTQCVFTNHFWTFAGDYFDTLTSKRLVPVFAVGSSTGGLFGGAIGVLTARALGPLATIAVWGALLCAAAASLVLARRSLRRWGPLDQHEADETSVAGIRGAITYVRGSRLGRWLVLSSIGMVLAQFVAQYIYSDVFVRAHPDPAALAVFIAGYLALTNLVEVALELWVTPWLIRRFGVAGSHIVHPALTVASFVALFASPLLGAAIAARATRELIDNAVAQPVRTLVFNALPLRFRGRIRAFLEGIVVYAGMCVAGLLLLALETPGLRALSLIGGAAALLYAAANVGACRSYLNTLLDGIRTGRLDLADLDDEIGDWEAARLAELCDELLRAESQRPSRSLYQLIVSLGQRGIAEPLFRGLSHPLASVRAECARALTGHDDARSALRDALTDRDALVRLAAIEALRGGAGADLAASLEPLLDDPDWRVRAAAASVSPATSEHLVRMLESEDPDARLAALAVAGARQTALIARGVDDADPLVRAAALERIATVAPDRVPAGAIARALEAADARVRCAALRAAGRDPGSVGRDQIARALRDPAAEVRELAVAALAGSGEAGVEAALPYLDDASESSASAALMAVASGEHPRRKHFLVSELYRRAALAWFGIVGASHLLPADAPAKRLLHAAAADAMVRHRRLAFRTLELLEGTRVVRRVERTLRFGGPRSRSDALEVLSNLGDRAAARLLVLMHEPGPLEERLAALGPTVAVPATRAAFLVDARRSDDRWMRIAIAAADAHVGDTPGADSTLMERLLALKSVPLFESLTLDQLDAVLRLARDTAFLPGEVIVREGDAGGELYLLLEGSAEAWLDYGGPRSRRLSTIEAGGYFGEMAILDDEPRSATVVARDPVRLLALDGESLKALVLQMPEIAFELLRVMTARVRASERQLLEGSH